MRIGIFVVLVGCGGGTSSIGDGGSDAMDATMSAMDVAAPDYGMCGKAAHDCLCACDGGPCDSCYNMYPACLMCINDSVTACCPMAYPAWLKCIDDSQKAMDGGPAPCAPSDIACQNARCMPEAAALQNCLGTQSCKTGARSAPERATD
jgi:hypothetical protein